MTEQELEQALIGMLNDHKNTYRHDIRDHFQALDCVQLKDAPGFDR